MSFAAAFAAITDCSNGKGKFMINKLDMDPIAKVTPGQNVSLALFYTNSELVTAGTTTTSVTYNFIPFQPTVADLCKSVVCPLEPGLHDGSAYLIFPDASGTVVTTITWKDSANNLLLCIKTTLSTISKALQLDNHKHIYHKAQKAISHISHKANTAINHVQNFSQAYQKAKAKGKGHVRKAHNDSTP